MTPDSRRSPRVNAPNVMVRVSTPERFRAVYLKDLSEGGLFIKTERPIAIGQKILVDLLPPGFTVPLRLPSTVVRHTPAGPGLTAGMAVTFDVMPSQTEQTLAALITSYQVDGPLGSQPAEQTPQLEALLEQYSNLKTAFDQRERELVTERELRAETARRSLALAAELEALKTTSGRAPTSSQADELKALLATAQGELSDARLRLDESQGNLAALVEELQVLEADDAASRKLAGVLAHEKLTLAKDLERISGELTKERAAAHARQKELDDRRAEVDSSSKDLLQAMQAELETRQLAVARHSSRADALQAQLNADGARHAGLEGEVSELRAQNATLTQKLAMAEKSARDAAARIDRLKTKERELRTLLTVVSGRSEEEVVVVEQSSEDEAAPAPAPLPLGDLFVDAPAPSPVPAPLGDLFVGVPAPSPVPAPLAAPAPASIDEWDLPAEPLSEDIDMEVEQPVAAAGVSREDFERRLHADEELTRTELFEEHQATDEIELAVKGLLESGPRFSELLVLARGVATQPQLLEVLFRLHAAGTVRFR